MSVVNNKITVKTEEGVTYGVSIADLRTAFGSSRVDLLAIICEDRPAMASTDADAADGITDGEGNFLYSAFALSDIYKNDQDEWVRQNGIPIPTGWSFISLSDEMFPNDRSYEKGDLIYGRKPRWNIWADGINVGKIIKEETSNEYYLRYNIFMNPWSNGTPLPTNEECPNLWPEGYTLSNKNRPSGNLPDLFSFLGYTKTVSEPTLEITGTGFGEWHNGVPTSCKNENTLRCRWVYDDNQGSIRNRLYDDKKVFGAVTESTNIFVKMALGNIVDWWKKTPYVSQSLNWNNTLYGMTAELSFKPEFYIETETNPVIANARLDSANVLGYDNTDKLKFKNGETVNVSSLLGVYRSYVWNELIRNNYPDAGSTVQLDILLNLIGIRILNAPAVLRPVDKVNFNLVVETKTGHIDNIIDPYTLIIPPTSRYRFILLNQADYDLSIEVGSLTDKHTRTYDVPKVTINNETCYIWPLHSNVLDINTLEHNLTFGQLTFDCIRFQFCLMKSLNATVENLVTGAQLRALWDVTFCDETTGIIIYRWKGVTDVLSVVNTKYGRTTDADATLLPADISTSVSKSAKAYVTGISTGLSGELILDTIPSATTAKLEIVPVDSVPAFLNTTDNYYSVADAFRYEIEVSPTVVYNYFILDYEPRFINNTLTLRCQIWSVQPATTSVTPITKFDYIPSNIAIQLCDKNYNVKWEWRVAKGDTTRVHGGITRTSTLVGTLNIHTVTGPAINPKPVLGQSTGHIIVKETLIEINFSELQGLQNNKDLIFNISSY